MTNNFGGNMFKNIEKLIIISVIALVVLVTGINSCSVVAPNERGVTITLGQVQDTVLDPGLHFKAPYVSSIRKYRVEPKTYEVTFSVGGDGAITKDMQTVGTTVAIRWMYDTARIMNIVKTYRDDSVIENAMRDNVKASVKETTGKYSIYELVSEQNSITTQVAEAVLERMKDYPIQISQTTITNWDWSDDFDRQIKETANRTQQVKQAEQEANIAEAKAQIQVREAQAKLDAEKLNAQAIVAKSEGEAKAKKIAADAQAYENQKIAQNLSTMQAQWRYEIELERAKKWNGKEVSDQSIYVPNTYDLKSGK